MKKLQFRFILILSGLSIFILSTIIFLGLQMRPTKKFDNPNNHSKRMERGQILDRNGEILAIQEQRTTLELWKPDLKHPEETAKILASIFEVDSSYLLEKFKKTKNSSVLFRDITEQQREQFLATKRGKKLQGIQPTYSLKRFYPLGKEASHILGFTDFDDTGKGGLEQSYNKVLHPANYSFNAGYGNNLVLTIDQNIQHYTEKIAERAFTENDADYSIFVVMDAKNGEILAMTARPTYDPNNLKEANTVSLANTPIVGAFEPGSVFKIFSIGAALDAGVITSETILYCNGGYEIPVSGKSPIRIKCLGNRHHRSQNYSDIIKNSCNTGTAKTVELFDNFDFHQALLNFGFGQKVGLNFPYENPGIISNPKKWSIRSKPTIAMGQEILTTAIQLATAATVYTNNGTLLKPHIVKRIEKPDGTIIQESKREMVRNVLSPETAQLILSAMEQNTLRGTGRRAKIEGIKISTKTGTGEIIDPKTKTYSDEAFLASCLAIFPTDDPEIIIYGAIAHPKGKSIFGASIVAPLIKELAIDCIYQFNLNKDSDMVISTDGTIIQAQPPSITLGETMPDFIGVSKRDLMQLYNDVRYSISIIGNGWVVRQSPVAGTPLDDSAEIILELE